MSFATRNIAKESNKGQNSPLTLRNIANCLCFLAIKFEMDHPRSIEIHYNNLLKNYVKGAFTKAEDNIILNDVKIHGNELQTFKNLSKKLNRPRPGDIKSRYEYLQNKPSKKPGPWQIEEDQMLMEHFFQVND